MGHLALLFAMPIGRTTLPPGLEGDPVQAQPPGREGGEYCEQHGGQGFHRRGDQPQLLWDREVQDPVRLPPE